MKDSGNKKIQPVVLAAAIFSVAMIIFPAVAESGSKMAIVIWCNSIVPVLLPFFFFSDFIKRTGELDRLPVRVYPAVVAFLSGYPMGAKIVGDFVREKRLGAKEGKWIMSYSLVTGPAFIIFTIGTFLGSQKAAAVVALAHYAGAFVNGFVHMNLRYAPEERDKRGLAGNGAKMEKNRIYHGSNYMEIFTEAIISGFKAMAMILAYLMLFTIGINMLDCAGIFELVNNETLSGFIKGVLEMTVGINLIGMCDASIKLKVILASALVSFGGLSVVGQSASMAVGCGIKFKDVLEIKLTHGMIAAVIATIFVNLVVL